MMKKVLITGILGMDGANMAEYLLANTEHIIYGMMRRSATPNFINILNFKDNPRFKAVYGDLGDEVSINNLVKEIQPDYLINFAANSFVGCSWDMPIQVFDTNTLGVLRCLEAIRKFQPNCRFYSAGCHDTETKVLTKKGLKDYTDVKIGDLVYSINPNTKDLEFKPVVKVFEYDYEGEMYIFKNGGLKVTPNHKMFYQTKRNNIKIKEAKEFIRLSDIKYPNNNPLIGKKLPDITNLSEFIPVTKKRGNKNYGKHISKIDTLDLMYLIGLYIGDGSCRIMKKKRKVHCFFNERERLGNGTFAPLPENSKIEIDVEYQCPQAVIDIPKEDEAFPKLVSILNKNNIKWKLHGQCDVTFHQWGLIPYFSECGHSASAKHIPLWILDLDSIYQQKVLEGIRDSDGDSRGNIYTSSKQLQQDLIKLHINCGIIPTFRERPPRTAILKDGRQIKGNFPEHLVYGLKEKTGYQKGNYTSENYSGKVWCLEVEDNHNFMVERNGKLTFSGNSSEEFGDVDYSPQDMKHPIKPRSPYGASKAAARHIVKTYRESYDMYAIHGILFNHEGIKRSEEFVTRKITKGIARIVKAIQKGEKFESIKLGNLDAKRDWSDSIDFVDGVWRMLNQELYWENKYEDKTKWIKEYILSSNETHSIREFCYKSLKVANIEGYWEGEGENERFCIANYLLESNEIKSPIIIEVSKEFFRPNEISLLLGDSTPARKELGWEPKISFDKLVEKMVSYDLNEIGAKANPKPDNNQ